MSSKLNSGLDLIGVAVARGMEIGTASNRCSLIHTGLGEKNFDFEYKKESEPPKRDD